MISKGAKMARTLHLVDAENLALTSDCTAEAVNESYLRYTETFDQSQDADASGKQPDLKLKSHGHGPL